MLRNFLGYLCSSVWCYIPLLVVMFTACAASQRVLHDVTMLPNVPFFKQEDFQCGPSALASVLNYWYQQKRESRSVAPDEIISHLYSPSARGVLGIDLLLYAKGLGFDSRQYRGSLDDIHKNIDRGVPLIVLVDHGFSVFQMNHFVVVTGYTSDGIVVHSGRERNTYISQQRLKRIWKKTEFWTLAIKPLE